MNVLVADIGGTKAQFSVYRRTKGVWKILLSRSVSCGDFPSASSLFSMIRTEAPKINACVVAAAGAVSRGSCTMTRLGWTLAERHIAKQFSVSRSRVRLLNDFEAAGYGVLTIAPSNSVLIKKGSHTKGIKAILGPGTGLGEAFVVPGKKHLVLPTEGGHSDFAPRTQEQWKLAQHIHRDVRSWEGVLSGSGLEHIYHFVSQGRKLTASEIAEQVPSNKDCEKAVRLFWDLLAQEAQNVALRTKSLGGVFISGGVARKLRRFLNRKRFETIFVDNTRMRYLLEQIPVHLVTSDSLELAGCLSIANTFQ